MPNIYVFREEVLQKLTEQLEAPGGHARYYQLIPFEFPPEQLLIHHHAPPNDTPKLTVPNDSRRGPAASDIENALQLYDWLGPLSETEARDPRLWAWMAHVAFADYTRARWPIPTGTEKEARNSIRDHWFTRREGRASMRQHSIARLWWAVHLTRAPWEHDETLGFLKVDDPYIYTRVFLGNQDVFVQLIDHEFGSNRRILIAMLEVIRRSSRKPSPLVRWLAKEVNLACRYRELDILPIDELLSLLHSLAALENTTAVAA